MSERALRLVRLLSAISTSAEIMRVYYKHAMPFLHVFIKYEILQMLLVELNDSGLVMGLDHWFKTSSGPISCNLIYVAKPCLCQRGLVERSWPSPLDLNAGSRRTQTNKQWHLIIGFAHVLISVPSSCSHIIK